MEFDQIKKNLSEEIKTITEIGNILNNLERIPSEEQGVFQRQLQLLERNLEMKNENSIEQIYKINLIGSFTKNIEKPTPIKREFHLEEIEKNTINRLKKRERKATEKKEFKPDFFASTSNKLFSKISSSVIESGNFEQLKRNLTKGNFPYLLKTYVSLIFFYTLVSFFLGIFLMIFFLFFNLSGVPPYILVSSESILTRIIKVIWIPFLVPLLTFFISYIYPSLEKSSAESKINHELPFAVIHMSAISGSNIEPSKIFKIVISTKEYPAIEKELYKIINEMNVFGKDMVSSLREAARKCPSKKLSDLFNGIATTVTSGGNLSDFFDKRASTLLLDYRLEREKETKSAETFMDIYISVVIAAPMILMLLLIMMKISGIGISFSTGMITLLMITAVTVINIGFMTLLHLKQNK